MIEIKSKPKFERILVQVDIEETKSASGLIIPSESKEMIASGIVVAVGDNVNNTKVGERILFNKHSGISVTVAGHSLKLMNVGDAMLELLD